MSKKLTVAIILTLIMTLLVAGLAVAQTTRGSIRGAVYLDQNADGVCTGTGEPGLAAIPLEFVSSDGRTVLNLQTGADGTYGLVAVNLGTWTVRVLPPAEYAATSATSQQVFISESNQTAEGVNFCLRRVDGTGELLPESGASAMERTGLATILLGGLLAGAAFVLLGVGLRSRETRRAG